MSNPLLSRWQQRTSAMRNIEDVRAIRYYWVNQQFDATVGDKKSMDLTKPQQEWVTIPAETKLFVTDKDDLFVYFVIDRSGQSLFVTESQFRKSVSAMRQVEPPLDREDINPEAFIGTPESMKSGKWPVILGDETLEFDTPQEARTFLDAYFQHGPEHAKKLKTNVDAVPSVDQDAEFDRLIEMRNRGEINEQQFKDKSMRLFGGLRAVWMTRRGADWMAAILPKAIASYKRDRSMGLNHQKAMEHALGNWQMVVNMQRQMAGQPNLTDAEIAALNQAVEQAVLGGGQGDMVVAHAMPDSGFIYGATPSGEWLAHLAKKKHSPAYEKETELIRENKKKPEAKKPHDFKPAKWTHPNGHPRCLVCGSEEIIGGRCNVTPTAKDYAEFEKELDAEFPDRVERRKKKEAVLHDRFERGEITQADMDQEMERLASADLSETLLELFAQGEITQTDMDQRVSRSRR